jgi:hypothetical protein
MDKDMKINDDIFKIGEIIDIINSPFEYEEGKPIFMIYIEHVFDNPEDNISFEIVTDKGLLVNNKLMNLAYLTNNENNFIKTDKVITQAPEFLEKVAPNLRESLLELINDKKLELDEIITLNNDLQVGQIIEYNYDYNTEYGKALFLIYISSKILIDDNGNAIPILGEKYLPTLKLLLIFDTGRIRRCGHKTTAKILFFSPDKFKITDKLIQDNPELLKNYPGLSEPVPKNDRRRIIRLIEEEKSDQQEISQSQKLPKGGRKKQSTFRKVSTFKKGGAKKYTFRKYSTFRKGGAKKYTFKKGGAKKYTFRKYSTFRKGRAKSHKF